MATSLTLHPKGATNVSSHFQQVALVKNLITVALKETGGLQEPTGTAMMLV